ncbi:glycosyltransferase family 4 protein [Patescibacteria group bacterium]|nr:glycosyltransferase family 4 protein [Patescibacteria group bacterium]
MKIVFLTRLFYPHIGGVEKHVWKISKELVEKGHEVIVITETPLKSHSNTKQSSSPSAKLMGETSGIKIFQINQGKDNWFKKFRIWSQLLAHRDIIEFSDVVHCHDVFYWYLPFKLIFPFKKVFTTFHGYEGNNIPTKKAIFSHKLAEKLSNGNICIGDFFDKWYGTNPTIISYGAVEIKDRQLSTLKPEKIRNALFIGRLEEETGIMEYLRALEILKTKGHKINLTVLGDGSQMKRSNAFAIRHRLSVDFKGFVKDVEKYLKNTDIVFVSRYLGILEALGSKKIVFAIYNNGIKKDYLETAEFSKYIYISSNSQSLANDIEHAILNKDYQKKIEDGFNWVKTQTWDLMCRNYLRLWGI